MTKKILFQCSKITGLKGRVARDVPTNGLGHIIPPSIEHVLIYFCQKKRDEDEAYAFFDYYSAREWQNKKGEKIKDWKVHAWGWIWNKFEIKEP